jgi:hypothetical protein
LLRCSRFELTLYGLTRCFSAQFNGDHCDTAAWACRVDGGDGLQVQLDDSPPGMRFEEAPTDQRVVTPARLATIST